MKQKPKKQRNKQTDKEIEFERNKLLQKINKERKKALKQ